MSSQRSRRVSMLDVHIALCAIAWGIVVLLPPNNLFNAYLNLRPLGQWGISEIVSGTLSIAGGVFHLWTIFKRGYIWGRWTMTLGSGWWLILFLSGIQSRPIMPATGVYLVTALMCGYQAVKAKHLADSDINRQSTSDKPAI